MFWLVTHLDVIRYSIRSCDATPSNLKFKEQNVIDLLPSDFNFFEKEFDESFLDGERQLSGRQNQRTVWTLKIANHFVLLQ